MIVPVCDFDDSARVALEFCLARLLFDVAGPGCLGRPGGHGQQC